MGFEATMSNVFPATRESVKPDEDRQDEKKTRAEIRERSKYYVRREAITHSMAEIRNMPVKSERDERKLDFLEYTLSKIGDSESDRRNLKDKNSPVLEKIIWKDGNDKTEEFETLWRNFLNSKNYFDRRISLDVAFEFWTSNADAFEKEIKETVYGR